MNRRESTSRAILTIRAAIGAKPEILIDEVPLGLSAQAVSLENLTIRCGKTIAASEGSLVKVSSQKITVTNCAFLSHAPEGDAGSEMSLSGQESAALGWTPFDSRDPKSGQINISNTVFNGPGAAIVFAKSPRFVSISNTLKLGPGAFASMGSKCLATDLKFELDHLTLRGTGPLLWLAGEFASKTGSPPTQIHANDSVFFVEEAKSGFIVVDAQQPRADIERSIQMRARESVVAPGSVLLTTYDPTRKMIHEEDADEQFEGLVASGIEFAGPNVRRVADARTARIQGPRVAESADHLPGIDLRRIGPAN